LSDALLFGRETYEMLAPFWSSQKDDSHSPAGLLNRLRKYVVSSTLKTADWNNSTIIGKNAIEEIRKLKSQPGGSRVP
jgi:dihydrofolate reductase